MEKQWRVLGVMFVVQVVGSFAYIAFTVLTPFFKSAFEASTGEIGLLVTLLYLGYFLSLTPGGIMTDHAGERVTLMAGLGSVALVAVALSAVTEYWMLAGGILLVGLAYGTIPSGTNKGIYDAFPPDQLTVGISVKQAGVMVGGAACAALLPWVAQTWGLAPTLALVGVLVSGTLLPLYVYRGEDPASARRVPSTTHVGEQYHRMWGLATESRVFPLLVSGVLFGVSQFTLMAYAVLYLTESLLLAPTIAGLVYTAMQLAGLVARTALGVLTDSWFRTRKHVVLVALGVVGALGYVPLAVLTPGAELWLVVAVSLVVGAVSLGYNGVYLTIASELAEADETGVATAIGISAVMVGAVTFPPLFGTLVDVTGNYSLPFASLGVVMLCAGAFAARIDTGE
ncbi:MFS transporter [Halorientalis litorea]|uniref:MFS transporter n=1 Tax=Halorientalis litorea TaxID=2931977 RepID=UPI001FF6D18D|nr:MFS transporter [Halorientalis litorea]